MAAARVATGVAVEEAGAAGLATAWVVEGVAVAAVGLAAAGVAAAWVATAEGDGHSRLRRARV